MAETISHTWQTVEQAAVTMNVSTRTVARRLANGSLESRVDENGRRLVLVQQIGLAADGDAAGIDLPSDIDDTSLATAEATRSPATQASQQPHQLTVLNVLETTITAARADATRARRSAKWSLVGVAAMAALVVTAAVLVSSTVTTSTVTAKMLREQLSETKADLKQTQSELMATRTAEAQATRELTDARRASELQRQPTTSEPGYAANLSPDSTTAKANPKATSAAAPATQPTLFNRVVSLFAD